MELQSLYTGIDLHKRTCFLTTIGADGKIVKQQKLRCIPDLIQRYFSRMEGTHKATVEATAGWYWISDLLQEEGIDLTLAHAKYLKAISYAKVKTDTVDSETLAQLLRAGLIPEAQQIASTRRGKRDVLRTRLVLVDRRSSAYHAIGTLCQKFNAGGPERLPALYRLQADCYREQIEHLTAQIRRLEQALHPTLVPCSPIGAVLTNRRCAYQ